MAKTLLTVLARHRSQLKQCPRLGSPAATAVIEVLRGPRPAPFPPARCLSLGTYSVAVRADDVALCGLRHEAFERHQACTTTHERELLSRWIAVVKIHLVRLESASAVGAWHPSPFAKHLGGAVLACAHTEDLLFAVAPVVVNVGWSLVAMPRH